LQAGSPLPNIHLQLFAFQGSTAAVKAKGTDIRWYSDRALTNLIATGEFHPAETKTVYATQKVNGYESVPRTIVVTILEVAPAPATNPLVAFCENYTGQVFLYAIGEEIRWYSDANKSQLLTRSSNYAVPAVERTYYLTQTLTGCESVPTPVTVEKITIHSEIYGTADKLEVKEKNGDFYAWYKNGFHIPNSNSSSIPYNGETGAYSVAVTKNNCTEYSDVYNMPSDLVTGVEGDTDADWSVYPNPARGYFTIDVKAIHGVMKIYDTTGRIVYTTTVNHPTGTSEMNHIRLGSGVYLVTFEDGTNMSSKRVVVF